MALDINVSIACSVVLYDIPSSVKEYVHIKADFSAFTHHTPQSSQSSGFRASALAVQKFAPRSYANMASTV
jgi:hypothetical protein